ncbi:MAG: S-methylmethionine-dependent homocysteine/selenocysteine methylase [Gammaproteobacteria bacterium]|jgi:S-methylmethionine-dependent homocysteine/selenocysteine methylase
MSINLNWMIDRLAGSGPPLIIDGGMGTELERSGVAMDGKVWSGRAVLSDPDIVRRIHESFIEAGAEVIIANTFAAGRHMLEPGGLGQSVREVNINAVKLAIQARESTASRPVAIAGSICEWAPTDDPKWHDPEMVRNAAYEQVECFAEAGADFIALEMCEQIEFSTAATEAAFESGLPIWLGLSAKRFAECDHLSVFDYLELPFEPLIKALAKYPAMMMNIMHTPIPDIDESLTLMRKHWQGPVGVYPESGFFKMPNWQFVDVIEPEELIRYAQGWVDQGVRMLGGCCGLGPMHISALRKAFG